MMKCTVYTDRPFVCKKYPHLEQKGYFKQNKVYSPYYFESCQYVEDNKLVESKLSQKEQEKYCMNCGLCCFHDKELVKTKNKFNIISKIFDEKWRDKKSSCKYLEII